jgi:hypothetical protein
MVPLAPGDVANSKVESVPTLRPTPHKAVPSGRNKAHCVWLSTGRLLELLELLELGEPMTGLA